jgi:hypothetical protein
MEGLLLERLKEGQPVHLTKKDEEFLSDKRVERNE